MFDERALVDGSAHTVVLADSVELTRLTSKCSCGHATVENVPTNESVRRQSEMRDPRAKNAIRRICASCKLT